MNMPSWNIRLSFFLSRVDCSSLDATIPASSLFGDKTVISSPSIFEGKVYFGSEDEKFYCLDAYSGEKYWSKSIPGGTSISSPTFSISLG